MLGAAGLDGVDARRLADDDRRDDPGSGARGRAAAPLGPCAAGVAELEIRAQATVGGNLCAPAGTRRAARRSPGRVPRARRGGALRGRGRRAHRARSRRSSRTGTGGSFSTSASTGPPPERSPASIDPTPTTTPRSPSASRARRDGAVRIAAGGVDGPAVRLPSAEAKADDPAAAGEPRPLDVTFADDALASAWYRERTLPVLVRRALTKLQEDA